MRCIHKQQQINNTKSTDSLPHVSCFIFRHCLICPLFRFFLSFRKHAREPVYHSFIHSYGVCSSCTVDGNVEARWPITDGPSVYFTFGMCVFKCWLRSICWIRHVIIVRIVSMYESEWQHQTSQFHCRWFLCLLVCSFVRLIANYSFLSNSISTYTHTHTRAMVRAYRCVNGSLHR